MSTRILRNSLATLVTAAALTLGGLANAAFFSSHFDPPGSVSFLGNGLFQLDDACLLVDGTYSAAACNLTLLSATLDLTDTVSGDTGHLDFAALMPDTADMINLTISGNELVGVNTSEIGWAFPSPCTGTLCGDPWWIEWGTSTSSDPVFLFTGSCDGDACFADEFPLATAFHVTFTRVPEPGTLVLLVTALGIGGLARRRAAA
jgi:hypothetical protein